VLDLDKQTITIGSVFVVRTQMEADQIRPIVNEFNAFNTPEPNKQPLVFHNLTVKFDVRISLEPGQPGQVQEQRSPFLRNYYYSQRWGPNVPRQVDSRPDEHENFRYIGGRTNPPNNIVMNEHQQWGNLGKVPDFVRHEMLHTFGLDDPGDRYWVAGGPMDYGVITGFIGAHDPTGENNVKLRRQEVSTILRLVEDYTANMHIPGNPQHVAGTPMIHFRNDLMPAGAAPFRSLNEAWTDRNVRSAPNISNDLPPGPIQIPQLPSQQPQPNP